MKEVVREIHACIHASGESINDYVREFSKVKDLALEANGTKPIQKAAFDLNKSVEDIECILTRYLDHIK